MVVIISVGLYPVKLSILYLYFSLDSLRGQGPLFKAWRWIKTCFGDRAFSAAGPRCWNSLPPVIHLADSVDSFKAQLKTHLFTKVYPN